MKLFPLVILLNLSSCSISRDYHHSPSYWKGVAQGYYGGCVHMVYVWLSRPEIPESQWFWLMEVEERERLCHDLYLKVKNHSNMGGVK